MILSEVYNRRVDALAARRERFIYFLLFQTNIIEGIHLISSIFTPQYVPKSISQSKMAPFVIRFSVTAHW